jgi:mRNA-degrading endonuclease toxin of MazEF toxin-antitoxin module
MNIQAQKIELTKQLLEINSEVVLKQIKALLTAHKTDLWDELSDEQKASVKRAKTQLANGEGVAHKDVMKKYKKWRTK